MSEALKILNNIRTLRAQARECTLETLEEMLEKLLEDQLNGLVETVNYLKKLRDNYSK